MSRKIRHNSTKNLEKVKKKDILPFFKLIGKIALAAIIPIGLMVFTYIVDPLQYYRPASGYMTRFYPEERYQNPAIAHSYKYDTVVVGTSMSENISIDKLKSDYGLNAIRQTFAGSSVFEQRSGLDVALRTGQVKNVIWELNFTSFGGADNKPKDSKAIFPYYLYDNNPFDKVEYLLDPVQLERAWQIVTNPLPQSTLISNHEMEILNVWETWFPYGAQYVWADFNQQRGNGAFDNTTAVQSTYSMTNIDNNFVTNVFDVVKANPNVQFVFYFAPFSVLEHASYEMQGIFENELEFRKLAFYGLSQFNNVRVIDFQGDNDTITNLDLYKDKMHYSPVVTNDVLYTIMSGFDTKPSEFEFKQNDLINIVNKTMEDLKESNYTSI